MSRNTAVPFACLPALLATSIAAQTPTIAEHTKGMQVHNGFFSFYRDDAKGKLFLTVDRWDQDFLYVNSLPFGVGSNDIGLDRGKLGSTKVVRFHRVGPKVLLIHRNLAHRASSANAAERRAVDEAFASSVIWGFTVAAATGPQVLVDATEFCMRDAFGVARALKRSEGAHKLDAKRSFLDWMSCKTFPNNTEVQAALTFTGPGNGRWLRQVAATATVVTVRQRHSFIRLPDNDYRPRRFDPRTGFMAVSWRDYAAPIQKPLVQQFIRRHRLLANGGPIVYYVDRGAPEPIRSALIEGASWWSQAFGAAGFKNRFAVELLPKDADPMDVRYNVIQWVHRASRGWSYGNSVVDPRTGEILKGHVTLGSRRVRQDYLIAQALVGNDPKACEAMALARLRQLSAHEVGHTLGLVHNFAASANGRASVMDYPHPLLKLDENGIDLSDAYATGIGEWDKFAIRWGYSTFPPDQEQQQLNALVKESQQAGLRFLSDRDARPAGGMHPVAHLWDNGTDPVAELRKLLAVRKHAMGRFGPASLADGEPLTRLDELFTPLYLLHRYQVEAVSKLIGGVDYAIAEPSDPMTVARPVDASLQRAALKVLLDTLKPEVLLVPNRIVDAIPPRTHGARRNRELLPSQEGNKFDPLAAAEVAARHTLRMILNGQRAARLFSQSARNAENLGLNEVLLTLRSVLLYGEEQPGMSGAVQRVVNNACVDELIALAAEKGARRESRAAAESILRSLGPGGAGHEEWTTRAQRFLAHPERYARPAVRELPPGSPIGCACGRH